MYQINVPSVSDHRAVTSPCCHITVLPVYPLLPFQALNLVTDVNESCHARGLSIFILVEFVQYVGVVTKKFNICALEIG